MPYPKIEPLNEPILNPDAIMPPPENGQEYPLEMGPNIKPLPDFPPVDEKIKAPVLLKTGDNVSTDEILPAGTRVLPFRSNIPEISKFTLTEIDPTFYERAMPLKESGSLIVGGANYGQGSSREHAAIAPRYLGVRAVIAKSYARIHRKNLINFGILPLIFSNEGDYDAIDQGDELEIENVHEQVRSNQPITVKNVIKGGSFQVVHNFSEREREEVLAGGIIPYLASTGGNGPQNRDSGAGGASG
jgi:aconitate hydratase